MRRRLRQACSPPRWAAGRVWLTALVLAASLVAGRGAAAAQQGGDPAWSPPRNLSNTPTYSDYPAIAADPSGTVHVLWGEDVDPDDVPADAIYYTRWDGSSWSVPVDVLLTPGQPEATNRYPAVASGPDGRLHVVWEGGFNGRILYSSARADEAGSARGWSSPLELNQGESAASYPYIAIGPEGTLHVVYAIADGLEQGIYYVASTDSGHSWSVPARVLESNLGPDKFLRTPRVAVGERGTVHVVFGSETPEMGFAQGNSVLYTRSTDSGATWDPLVVVTEGPFGSADVATSGDEVLVTWAGTHPQRFRFSQWSMDDGLTWSAQHQTSEAGGLVGNSGMAVDSAGAIHLTFVATDYRKEDHTPTTVFHMQWTHGSWSAPEAVMVETVLIGDFTRTALAISEGNLVHIVAQTPIDAPGTRLQFTCEIYYSQRRVDSPYIAPEALPTVQPQASATVEPTATGAAVPTIAPTATRWTPDNSSPVGNQPGSPVSPLLIGTAGAMAVLAVSALASAGRRRRR